MSDSFDLILPRRRTTPAIFASPHSGRVYTREFLRRTVLTPDRLRSSEDAFIDRLFGTAPDAGAPLLLAQVPRAWIDLNRAPDEFDPALIAGVRRGPHNPRIASGLGVVPRVVAGGRSIYRGKITLDEARGRVRDVWRPYHATLRQLVDETLAGFGRAILIDCHSMPHEALEGLGPRGARPDVVLGDRFGKAASAEVMDAVEAAFVGAGLRVGRNAPFAGAYTAQHYGRPEQGSHVVQVEIDRALYMDETRIAPLPGFDAFAAAMAGIVADIAAIGAPGMRLAAE
ncbi:N-formylglutamate amidohydrolase [Oceaniovalibus guishaninsula]|nr:N-formylglutamate amidohydrolase [Oceaniovalibus guishaninsula]